MGWFGVYLQSPGEITERDLRHHTGSSTCEVVHGYKQGKIGARSPQTVRDHRAKLPRMVLDHLGRDHRTPGWPQTTHFQLNLNKSCSDASRPPIQIDGHTLQVDGPRPHTLI